VKTNRRSITASSTGDPSVLRILATDLPELGIGEIRVRTLFAGVNFWDVMQRRGSVPLPGDQTPGVEGVGIVDLVGPSVDPQLMGLRVAWSRVPSSYSTFVQGPASSFVPVPPKLDDETAAAVLMQGITAQYLAESTTNLRRGQTALVTAAAGGVGSLLLQFLGSRSVDVVGVVSRADKSAVVESLGARCIIDSDNLHEEVHAIHPEGVDAVFDAIGGDVNRLIELVSRRGICVLYGSASGGIDPVDIGLLSSGSRYLTRTAGRDYATTPEEWRSRADDVLSRAASGSLSPVSITVLPLGEAEQAHRLLESRASTGKILLSMSVD